MTTERKSYSSNKFQLELPYLIEVQKASYEQFLQKEIPQEKRLKVGLERVFQDIFPITDVKGLYSLNYEGYYFGIPKYSIPGRWRRPQAQGRSQERRPYLRTPDHD